MITLGFRVFQTLGSVYNVFAGPSVLGRPLEFRKAFPELTSYCTSIKFKISLLKLYFKL